MRTRAVVVLLLALAACNRTQSVGPGITKNSHPWFPITSGVHAIGANSANGAIECASCHSTSAATFKQFSCVDCHNHNQAATDTLHAGVKDYAFTSSRCLSCHPSGAKVAFNHAGITDGCAKCHDVGGPNASLPVPGFTHPPMNGKDCSSCHKTTTWKTSTFDHTGITGDCAKCHDVGKSNAALPIPGFTHPPMNGSDCSSCHKSTTTWKSAAFDHTGITSGCAKCHDEGGSSAALPVAGFTHPAMNGNDCSNCHKTTTTWKSATYDHTGILGGCAKCHDVGTSYPALPVAGFTHPPMNGNDCSSCHRKTTDWKGATYDHEGITSGCAKCHDVGGPNAALPVPGFTHRPMNGADCSSCHNTTSWTSAAGAPAGKKRDPKADVTVNALVPTYAGTRISALTPRTQALPMSMDHGSKDIDKAALDACANCHPDTAAGNFVPGYLHASLATLSKSKPSVTQPKACASCHNDAVPIGFVGPSVSSRTPASGPMKHDAVIWANGKPTTTAMVSTECGLCHASSTGGADDTWAKGKAGGTTVYHASLKAAGQSQPSSCIDCHANSTPAGLTSSTTPTSAQTGTTTGIPAGTMAQFTHADGNVSGRDCNFCHTQVGPSTQAGVQGKEWAQAKFHANFTSGSNPPLLNTTTGRCSNCHLAEKPGAGFSVDHSSFTNASGSQDCASCHKFPGTGTATAPNWLGAVGGAPQYITVGGFPISQPPATSATTQAGISNLPHPAGTDCTSCHTNAGGGKQATGYDHKSTTLIGTKCSACHEAGSNLVGTKWNGATSQGAGAGDTRPFTIAGLVPSTDGNRRALTQGYNHFFAVDCGECHLVPAGNGTVTTGTAYTRAWRFDHQERRMQRSTCNMCHGSPNNIPD